MTALLALIEPISAKLIGALMAALALAGLYLKARSDGRRAEAGAQAARDLEAERKVSDAKDRMAAEVARGPDAQRTTDRMRNGEF